MTHIIIIAMWMRMNTTPSPVKIDKGIPIPRIRPRNGKWSSTMSTMKVGDSFLYPRKSRNNLAWMARNTGISITTRKVSDSEVRVWRTH